MQVPGGVLLVRALESQGVSRVFCVPGESYLPVLDALHDSTIETVVCRQEGGAAMMADADGKMTGRPGICFVTRGPGATNAACGVHVAAHDMTPMILFVGQVPHEFRGRGAFQELDYDKLFGGMAKAVFEAKTAEKLPGLVERAYRIAMEGAPGPVVVALPEDTLSGLAVADRQDRRFEPAAALPPHEQMEDLWALLAEARSPIAVLGGSRWTDGALADIRRFAENWRLPVACSFRRQMLFPSLHPNHAGDVGIGIAPALRARIENADLVLAVGARFGEMPSQGYELLAIPQPAQKLVHVLPDAHEIGRLYRPALGIQADPASFARKAVQLAAPATVYWAGEVESAHRDYLAWSTPSIVEPSDGPVDLDAVMAHLAETLPAQATLTNGAGNYGGWVHRYGRFSDRLSQLAPTSGSMGYGLPAAIAAKLRHPERTVVCFAGDGCFQMTSQEFGTAVEHGAAVIVLVVDNGQYGTIRMHQEKRYPGRISGTALRNPDFSALARSYGAFGEKVERMADFAAAFARARAAGGPALLHLTTDPNRLSTTMRI